MELIEHEDVNMGIEEVKEIIEDVLNIDADEWPSDKAVEITTDFMVVPKNIKIRITKQ